MITVHSFTFNPFFENTYILFDESKECIIIDPGCNTTEEQQKLVDFIDSKQLRPVRLINTHCHLDHIFGNHFVAEKFQLGLEIHQDELPVLDFAVQSAAMYGVSVQQSPAPSRFIEDNEMIGFGNSQLKSLLTPGHSPASLSFFSELDNFVIAGDVLFFGSIGRTDLPGGDHQTLINSIKDKLFPLGDSVVVYSGHGPKTSIGYEKQHNPFL